MLICEPMTQDAKHISVMSAEVVEALKAAQGGNYLDCTLGAGGHTRSILEINRENSVLAIDRDSDALAAAKNWTENFRDRVRLEHGNFSEIESLCADDKFDGVLADLGLSTDQLRGARGFSFLDESLDMRMDRTSGVTAKDLVNQSDPRELFKILKQGGVGREAKIICDAIIRARPFESAKELSTAVNQALQGKTPAGKKINPSTVLFQALRIAVNNELEDLERFLKSVPKIVKSKGRLAVITFHSIEDKLVAAKMRSWEGEKLPALWPGSQKEISLGKLVSRKAIEPTELEIKSNPSSRSARLRVFEFNFNPV